MITHLEPDILECDVKWTLRSITTNKATRAAAARQQQPGEPQLAVLPPDPAREVSPGPPAPPRPRGPSPSVLCLCPLQERADVQQRAHGRRALRRGAPGRGPEGACPQGW